MVTCQKSRVKLYKPWRVRERMWASRGTSDFCLSLETSRAMEGEDHSLHHRALAPGDSTWHTGLSFFPSQPFILE